MPPMISKLPLALIIIFCSSKTCALSSPVVKPIPHTNYEKFSEPFEHAQFLMPSVVENSLIKQDNVDPYDLLERLDMSTSERLQALSALESDEDHITTVPSLTVEECAKLRKFVRERIKDDGIDDVDGCPDFQVNISEQKLGRILGKRGVQALWDLPQRLESTAIRDSFSRVGVFIRMYQRETRPWMPFHMDGSSYTVNVALNPDSDYMGGRLLALHKNAVCQIERNEGDATCHRGNVIHGVSSIVQGTRYSMILFFHSDN